MPMILSIRGLTKSFRSGHKLLTVVNNISLDFEAGTTTAIVGPSGSGKTTLLGLCAGLDDPTEGQVVLENTRIDGLDEDSRARIRNQAIGFVFQNFQLMPTLTALENVMVPLELRREKNAGKRAETLLAEVGLSDRENHYPVQLSGGEQQRVALARAFINRPKILFADEPTGNLDAETGGRIESLLFKMNQDNNTTLIMATHDLDLANRTDRIIKLQGGMLVDESVPEGSAVM